MPVKTLAQSSVDPGPCLLFGSTKPCSREEVLSQLPSKYSCDMLVTRFFAHEYPAVREWSTSGRILQRAESDDRRYTTRTSIPEAGNNIIDL